MNVVPITAVSLWLPRYSHRPHYNAVLYFEHKQINTLTQTVTENVIHVRFLNRGVTLGLVNPRSVGYPWGKSRGNLPFLKLRLPPGLLTQGNSGKFVNRHPIGR